MSFSISVHHRADDLLFRSPPDVHSKEFDHWFDECMAKTVYDNPLGSDGSVHEFWHVPALQLGLPLIRSIYNDGLWLHGVDLERLGREADTLERYWKSLNLTGRRPYACHTIRGDGSEERTWISVRDHLRERMGYLREAIRVAKAEDGVLSIG